MGKEGGVSGRRGGALLGAVMLALFVFQMLRQFLPGAVHEVTGIALATCAVAHVVRNRRWFAGLARGRWTARRALIAVVSCALSAVMLGTVACGVGMSGLAVDLGLARNTMQLRSFHIALTHLGFLLAGLHVGLHVRPVAARVARAGRRCLGLAEGTSGVGTPRAARTARMVRIALGALALAVAAYGAHAFAKLDFAGYISLKTRFAFIDPSQPVVLFALDHAAVLVLCALIACALDALLAKVRSARH